MAGIDSETCIEDYAEGIAVRPSKRQKAKRRNRLWHLETIVLGNIQNG